MIGETPTTVFARTASAMPGTARMVPMLTTGLDGGNRTTSASVTASSTPGAGLASSAPGTRHLLIALAWSSGFICAER